MGREVTNSRGEGERRRGGERGNMSCGRGEEEMEKRGKDTSHEKEKQRKRGGGKEGKRRGK